MRASEVAEAISVVMSGRETALVRHARLAAMNDKVPGTTTPDDGPFLLALTLICIGIVGLTAFVLMSGLSGPDDLMAVLRR